MLTYILKKYYGDFSAPELKKYLFLGSIFALIVGLMWSLMPLRDALFCQMTMGFGKCQNNETRASYIALAKIISMLLLIPVVALYGYFISRIRKKLILITLGCIYAMGMLFFMGFFWYADLFNPLFVSTPWMISGWLWYTFIESFNVFFLSAFWAFVLDVSTASSATRAFGLIIMIGQIGGMILPYCVHKIPRIFGTTALTALIPCSVLMLAITVCVWLFITLTPQNLLTGYAGQGLNSPLHTSKKAGLLEGFMLIARNSYLLGILCLGFCFEFVVNIMDFNFKTMALASFNDAVSASEYLALYATLLNITIFALLLLGINNIQRFFGLKYSFITVFIGMLLALLTFKVYPSLTVIFWLLIIAKALNLSLNTPALKQLYIPTHEDVRYKSQAWIETFGISGAKASASSFGLARQVLEFSFYITLTFYTCMSFLGVSLLLGILLARKQHQAVKNNKIIC